VPNHFFKRPIPHCADPSAILEPLEARVQLAGDLAVTVGEPTLKFVRVIENHQVMVPVTIRNVGDQTVTARFRLQLFFSSDRAAGADYPYASIDRLQPIRAGQSFSPDMTAALPHDPLGIVNGTPLPQGAYFVRASIVFLSDGSDADASNNTAFSTSSVAIGSTIERAAVASRPERVTIPTGPFQSLVFEIAGPGQAVIASTGSGVSGTLSLTATGTTRTSIVRVSATQQLLPGSVSNITVTGSLKRLDLPGIIVTGNIAISGGLRSINAAAISGSTWSIGGTDSLDARIGVVVNTSLSTAGDVNSMTVGSWTTDDGGTDAIVARSIRRLTVDGDFAPRLRVSAGAGTVGIGGSINSFMDVTGSIVSLSAGSARPGFVLNATTGIGTVRIEGDMQGRIAAPSIRNVTIGGSMSNASILAGTSLGSNGDIGGTEGAADVFGAGSLGSLLIRGAATNSLIASSLDHVDGQYFNADDRFRSSSSRIGRIRIIGATFNTNFAAISFAGDCRINGLSIIPSDDARFRSDFPRP
jgi:hypothetical protein